jgi:hypothetical protein
MDDPPQSFRAQRKLRIILFIVGVVLLASGGPTALFVPILPGESYLHANWWALLAIALSVALFVVVGAATARSRGSKRLGIFVLNALCFGLVAVFGLWVIIVPIVAIINSVMGALGHHASTGP